MGYVIFMMSQQNGSVIVYGPPAGMWIEVYRPSVWTETPHVATWTETLHVSTWSPAYDSTLPHP